MPRDDACNYQMSKFDQLKEFVLYCCNILVNRAYNFQICYRLLSERRVARHDFLPEKKFFKMTDFFWRISVFANIS